MKRSLVPFAFFSIVLCLTFGDEIFAQQPKTKAMVVVRTPTERVFNSAFKGKVEAEIELVEHQLSDALRVRDVTALENLLSETVLTSALIGNKAQLIALLKMDATKYFSFEKSDMRIQLYGDTAVATGTLKVDIEIENGSRFSQGTFFNTWKKIDGRWQCIALTN
jgi:ketosteroid isomerase-like protein